MSRIEIFHDLFGEIHVAVQIAERHFRLDHPEFVGVPRGVRVLRAKRWTEGVNLRKRAGERLGFELAADRQISLARKKIFRVIDVAVLFAADSLGSIVETRNNSPAPSQSLPVMIGVWT